VVCFSFMTWVQETNSKSPVLYTKTVIREGGRKSYEWRRGSDWCSDPSVRFWKDDFCLLFNLKL
jgi:hypothetical protein